MKKTIVLVSIAAGIILSCKKEKLNSQTSINPTMEGYQTGSKTVHNSMNSYVMNSNDREDEAINLLQMKIGIVLKDFLKNPGTLNEVLKYAKESKVSCINLMNYFDNNSDLRKLANEKLNQLGEGQSGDPLISIKDKLRYNNDKYTLALYVPNINEMIFNGDFYVALGNDIEHENKDYIPSWKIKNNGQESIVLIDEDHGTKSKDPVIIITLISDLTSVGGGESKSISVELKPQGKVYQPPLPPTCTSKTRFVNMECKLGLPCENDNTLEYRAIFYNTGSSIGTGWDLGSTDKKEQGYMALADIPKSYVGYGFTLGGQYGGTYWQSNEYCLDDHFAFVSFERDWYTPPKPFLYGNATFNIEAKYSSDYYQVTIGNTVQGVLTNGGNTNGWYLWQKGGYHGLTRI